MRRGKGVKRYIYNDVNENFFIHIITLIISHFLLHFFFRQRSNVVDDWS